MCKQQADQHLNVYGILIDKILVEELMTVKDDAKNVSTVKSTTQKTRVFKIDRKFRKYQTPE